MAITITYPSQGRGAWPDSGLGGTLDGAGNAEGPLYRAPAGDQPMPGLVAARAIKAGTTVDINHYAVYCTVKALQAIAGTTPDGIFGSQTGRALSAWQDTRGLVDDGHYGRITSTAMWLPFVNAAVNKATADAIERTSLRKLAQGHIAHESGWDPGAVGVTTPQDLGLGQINGPAHPAMAVEDRLNPRAAIPFIVQLVQTNMQAMGGVENDAIAAYYLGVAGAKEWVRLDRPEVWKGKFVKRYIRSVLAAQ